MSAILSRGSNAPSTVVPAVAQTRNGADPCNRIQNKKIDICTAHFLWYICRAKV